MKRDEKEQKIIGFEVNRRLVKKSITNSIIYNFFLKFKGLITVPIITYLLAPAELGKYFYILSLTSIMVPMFILNLADGPVLHFVQENDILKIKRMYYTVQNTTIISLFFFNVVLLLISHFIDLKFSDYIGYVILIILCQSIFKITSYLLVVYQKTDILIRYSFTKEIISFVIGILLLIAGIGIRGLMVGIILTDVVAGMLIGLKIYKEIGYEPIIDTKYLVKFLKISIPLLPVFFFSWIMLALDTFLLMYLQGAYSVGIYNIAYSLSSIILTVTFALNFFWFPVSAKMWGESREKYKKLFKVLFSVASVLLLCMVVLFELNAEFILKFLVKNTEYYAAKPIIGIISFAMAMRVLITLLTAPLYSNKNSFMIFLTNFVGAFVTVILDILLIPKYGISGAAITTAISYFLVVFGMSISINNVLHFDFLEKRGLVFTTGIFLLWLCIVFNRGSLSEISGFILSVIFIGIVAVCFFVLFLSREENKYIYSKMHELKKAFQDKYFCHTGEI